MPQHTITPSPERGFDPELSFSMQQEILELLDNKLSESLRVVDENTAHAIRAIWDAVNPSPTCPAAAKLLKEISQTCHRGLVQRGEEGRKVVVTTLQQFRKFLNAKFVVQILEVVERHFPEDQYVALVKATNAVYRRRQAPPHKFNDRIYELEVAAMTAKAANLSRLSVGKIRTAINELRLQRIAALPTVWERVCRPLAKWALAISVPIAVAVILYFLEINS